MVFTQEKKSESTITIVRTELIMAEDGATEKLNVVGSNGNREVPAAQKFADEEELFDSLIEKIGNDGKFQRRFDIVYNFILVMCVSMPYLNIILAMTIPDHWCYLPGREMTNLTIEQWKEMHIPRYVTGPKSPQPRWCLRTWRSPGAAIRSLDSLPFKTAANWLAETNIRIINYPIFSTSETKTNPKCQASTK